MVAREEYTKAKQQLESKTQKGEDATRERRREIRESESAAAAALVAVVGEESEKNE
jgi:hypothetical protein